MLLVLSWRCVLWKKRMYLKLWILLFCFSLEHVINRMNLIYYLLLNVHITLSYLEKHRGLMNSTSASHANEPGSIPGMGMLVWILCATHAWTAVFRKGRKTGAPSWKEPHGWTDVKRTHYHFRLFTIWNK